MPTSYPWERRWLEISASKAASEPFHRVESTGYVAATEWTGQQTELIGMPLAQLINDRQVVVLLGEPGIGKSSEWRKLGDQLANDKQHLFLNLGSFGSEDELRETIATDSNVLAWKQADYMLTLWLDSLDEGLLHLRRLQDTLLRLLQRLPLDRLHLRLTCRNAVWPVAFTEALGNLWKFGRQPTSEQLSILVLRPLTQQQVADAAQAEKLPPGEFLAAVAEVDAQPLASIPVTLHLLLSLYQKYQPGFGATETAGRAGLYELGCLHLCDAPDKQREEQHRHDGRQRLVLAGYLAYLAVFSNRRQIHLEPVKGSLLDNALDPYAAGAGLTAPWGELRATITPAAIRDLLKNTSLFTDLGNGCLVWVHQAFAEFLAAWYVNLARISLASLRALFRSEADPAGGVVPALRETAAWLAELQPAFWQELLRLDPLALIRGDLRRLRDEQRSEVVQHLATVIGTLAYPPYLESREHSFRQQLRHPGLATQLAAWLTADEVPSATVQFAVDMTKGCQVQELAPLLVEQALDETQPFRRRAYALDILLEIATDEAKHALRPLLHRLPAEDVRDEFRGDLLWILWPTHLGPDELLPLLTPERDDHYLGGYQSFLYALERTDILFSAASIKASLRWLGQNWQVLEHSYRRADFWKRLSRLVWRRAWQLIAEPGMAETVADAYAIIIEHHGNFSAEEAPDAARLEVLQVVLTKYYRRVPWVKVLFSSGRRESLITSDDWEKLYPLLYSKLSYQQRTWLAEVLASFVKEARYESNTTTYCQHYAHFLTATGRYASVRAVWQEWFNPLKVRREHRAWLQRQESLRQEKLRKEQLTKHHRRLALRKLGQQAQVMQWAIQREVRHACNTWYDLLRDFQHEKTERNTYTYHEDFNESKRWQKLPASLKTRILDRLWEFMLQHPAPPPGWYGPGNRSTYCAEMLRQSLVVSYSQREHLLRGQPAQFWQDLAPFLVRFDEGADRGSRYELLRLAASQAPAAVESALVLSMDDRDNLQDGRFSRFKDWYRLLPGARFPALLLQGIEFGVWREELSAQVLVAMLEVGYAPAAAYVRELLCVPAGQVIKRPILAQAVFGSVLFRKQNIQSDAWQYWEWLSQHLEIARAVISLAISRPTPSEFNYLTGLAEAELEALALWLTYVFHLLPTDVDDWRDTNPRGKYAGLRTAAVTELATRGTASAWRMLEYLDEQLGRPFWLRGRLDQVRENLRRNAWAPTRPGELIEVSQQAGKRWLKSAADLQELVLESLARLQADLHNELAVANILWVPQKEGLKQVSHSVRDENFLSDVLRFYLDKDLRRPEVLVKREVEIRKSIGEGTGQRTDLYIDAFSRNETGDKVEVVTVVIEVKLAKNSETETALRGQLVPYLADQAYKHGIYLIGWHYGQYDNLPGGKKKDLPALHQLLQTQTAAVPDTYSIRTLLLDIRLPADEARCSDAASLFEAF